eukprot:scaffold12153_cov135-Isochrysis_galbana.AAC.1
MVHPHSDKYLTPNREVDTPPAIGWSLERGDPTLQHCGSMIVPWGAVGPTTAVGVCKPPHAPERGMVRPPRDTPLRQ